LWPSPPKHDHDALQEHLRKKPRSFSETPTIARHMPALVDPQWGLERMIGTLAKIDIEDLGPFPK
jgi:hypothetical protein